MVLAQLGAEVALGGMLQQPPIPTRRLSVRWSQARHSGAWWEDNGFKLKQGRSRLDMRRNFFPGWAVKQWSRLP